MRLRLSEESFLIARNDDVDNETDLTRVPNLTKSIRLWRRLRTELNEVPEHTPGTQSGIGHVLTVISTADKGYAFRAPLPSAIMNFVQTRAGGCGLSQR